MIELLFVVSFIHVRPKQFFLVTFTPEGAKDSAVGCHFIQFVFWIIFISHQFLTKVTSQIWRTWFKIYLGFLEYKYIIICAIYSTPSSCSNEKHMQLGNSSNFRIYTSPINICKEKKHAAAYAAKSSSHNSWCDTQYMNQLRIATRIISFTTLILMK